MYVEELIGPETVNTMPLETIEAFQDHGVVERHAGEGVDEAREAARGAREAGVDYDDVVDTLEREGVQKFSDSFAELLEGITREARRARLGVASRTAQLVDRIWSRDPSVWTGSDEAQWLGWLDEPLRMHERVHELLERFARVEFDASACSGWGVRASRPRC